MGLPIKCSSHMYWSVMVVTDDAAAVMYTLISTFTQDLIKNTVLLGMIDCCLNNILQLNNLRIIC